MCAGTTCQLGRIHHLQWRRGLAFRFHPRQPLSLVYVRLLDVQCQTKGARPVPFSLFRLLGD
jgi:hypothetical protein